MTKYRTSSALLGERQTAAVYVPGSYKAKIDKNDKVTHKPVKPQMYGNAEVNKAEFNPYKPFAKSNKN